MSATGRGLLQVGGEVPFQRSLRPGAVDPRGGLPLRKTMIVGTTWTSYLAGVTGFASTSIRTARISGCCCASRSTFGVSIRHAPRRPEDHGHGFLALEDDLLEIRVLETVPQDRGGYDRQDFGNASHHDLFPLDARTAALPRSWGGRLSSARGRFGCSSETRSNLSGSSPSSLLRLTPDVEGSHASPGRSCGSSPGNLG
jgi:hypothetical protein